MASESAAVGPGGAPPPAAYGLGPRLSPWQKALRNPLTLVTQPPFPGISVLALLGLLLVWEAVVALFGIRPVLLPAPSLVLQALGQYLAGDLLLDASATGMRILVGLVLGASAGIAVGLAMGWYPKLRAVIGPHVALTFPIPKSALIPLMIIWFGTGDPFKVYLVAAGVFYIMLTNTLTGVESIPTVTIMAARNLGARDRDIFWKVILPGSLPVVAAALRISFSVSLILGIFGEMVVSPNGLGRFIANSGQLLETEKVFAGLIVVGLIGLLGYQVIDRVEQRLMPWRKDRHQQL
jgi:NitT/TauT family transport system permease protein